MSSAPAPQEAQAERSWLVWTLIGLLGLLCLYPIFSNDDWWHLAYGRWIVEHGALPTTDSFSWTHAGQPIRNVPWLSSLFFYGVWSLGGVAGLVLLKPLAAWICMGVAWLHARREGVRWTWFALVLALAFLLIHPRLVLVRALMTTFAILPLMQLLWSWSRAPERRRWQWGLLPLAWIWSNGHGSFPVMLAWIALTAGWSAFLGPERSKRDALEAVGLILGVAATTLLNPTGWSTWGLILGELVAQQGQTSTILQLTGEAQHLTWATLLGSKPTALLLGLLSLPFLAALSWRRFGGQLLFWGLMWLMALGSQRFLGLCGLAALLYMPGWLEEVQRTATEQRWARLGLRAVWRTLAISAALTPLWVGWYVLSDQPPLLTLDFGLHVRERNYPGAIVQFIKAEQPQGKLYNAMDPGGYLIWHLPERPVFMDGRTNVLYSERFFAESYGNHILGDGQLPKTLDRWDATLAIVAYDSLAASLWDDPEWTPVAYDDAYALFLRRGRANDALIDRYAYKRFQMTRAPHSLIEPLRTLRRTDPAAFQQLRAETHRAAEGTPYPPAFLKIAMQLTDAVELEGQQSPPAPPP